MVLSSTGYQQLVQVPPVKNVANNYPHQVSVEADKSEKNVVWVTFTNGYKGKIVTLSWIMNFPLHG